MMNILGKAEREREKDEKKDDIYEKIKTKGKK